jgi:hypothetical protein
LEQYRILPSIQTKAGSNCVPAAFSMQCMSKKGQADVSTSFTEYSMLMWCNNAHGTSGTVLNFGDKRGSNGVHGAFKFGAIHDLPRIHTLD